LSQVLRPVGIEARDGAPGNDRRSSRSRALQRDGDTRAMRQVSQIYDEALAPGEPRSTQRLLLVAIGRATKGELAASLVLGRSAMAHNVKPLEREGLSKSS
jgi:hypothetical protein